MRRALLGRLGMTAALLVSASGRAQPLDALLAQPDRRSNIERDFHTTLARCSALAPHTRAAFGAAVGELVFPTIVSTGVDEELAGDGALRVAQAVTDYYLLSAMPARGMPERLHSLIFLFMTFGALSRFQRAQVWPAGEQDLAVPLIGADGRLDPRSRGAPVLAIALGEQRLLPSITFKSLRIAPLDL